MVSNEFLDAFIVGGGPTEECDFCGSTFYSTTTLEESELEYYELQRTKRPTKYFPEPVDSIEFCMIEGRRYVYGCPCNAMDKYERFIWEHREQILTYLRVRAEMEYNEKALTMKHVEEATKAHVVAREVAEQLTNAERALAKATEYM